MEIVCSDYGIKHPGRRGNAHCIFSTQPPFPGKGVFLSVLEASKPGLIRSWGFFNLLFWEAADIPL